MEGIVIPADAERVSRGTGTFRVLAELPEYEAIEMCFGPEFEGVDLHVHDDHLDSFYILDGEAEFTIDGEVIHAGPGTYVAAPAGVEHAFRNAGQGNLRLVNIHAPNTGWARRFHA